MQIDEPVPPRSVHVHLRHSTYRSGELYPDEDEEGGGGVINRWHDVVYLNLISPFLL